MVPSHIPTPNIDAVKDDRHVTLPYAINATALGPDGHSPAIGSVRPAADGDLRPAEHDSTSN